MKEEGGMEGASGLSDAHHGLSLVHKHMMALALPLLYDFKPPFRAQPFSLLTR